MLHDIKTACRQLRHTPVFTASAIAIIALAVGVNAAIFAVADGVLFRPLPYAHPDALFVIRMGDQRTGVPVPRRPVPFEYVSAIAEHHTGIAGVGMRSTQALLPFVAAEAEWVNTVSVTPAYLRVLGVRPLLGRLFDARDTVQFERVALLTYNFWQRRFGGDAHVVGKTMQVGTTAKEIVGVLPRGFVFPSEFLTTPFGPHGKPDYVTAAREPVASGDKKSLSPIAIGGIVMEPIVRLRPGVTREQAQAEIDVLAASVRTTNPRFAGLKPLLQDVRSVVFPAGTRVMTLLVVAAGLVLLVGCGNLAIMLLVRTRRREAQLGVLMALGATRVRIVRPLLFEALVIGLGGASVGLLAATFGFSLLLRQVPPVAYGSATVGIDTRVAVFGLTLGLASGLIFGAVPAWRATALDVQALLVGRARFIRRRQGSAGGPLVVSQVAVAVVLVFASVVAARAFVGALRTPLGFTPDNIVLLRVDPDSVAFYEQAMDRLARLPGVVSVGAASSVPLDGWPAQTSDEDGLVGVELTLPGYLETVGATLLRGRLPRWDDVRSGLSAAVVSQSAARALFGDLDPLGRSIRLKQGGEATIVGMVGDMRKVLDGAYSPSVFALAGDQARLQLLARVATRRPGAAAEMRREIGKLLPGEPVIAVWWSDSIDALVPFSTRRFQSVVLGTFAALALTLTALGVFAVVAFIAAMRAREMGVRLALGASPRSLVGLMVRQALGPIVAGAALGVLAARWLSDVMEAHLFGVEARDPVVLVGAVAGVVMAACLAAYVPARGASRVDPVEVLRAP
jgi:predicted permease